MLSSVCIPLCKACNSSQITKVNIPRLPLSAQPFKSLPSDSSSFDTFLYLCDQCGHMYLDIPPVPYYKNVIRSVSVSSEMSDYRRTQFRSISLMYTKSSSDIKVLEIGAGNGQYAKLLSETFPLCFATEPNPIFSSENSFKFIDTHPDDDDFELKLSEHGLFDFICCFSYLEHLPFPNLTLLQIERLLAPGGYALIEVPNCDYIRKKGLLSEVIPDHLHYFSSQSLISLAHTAKLNLHSLNPTWNNYILSCVFQKSENTTTIASRLSRSNSDLQAQIYRHVLSLSADKKIAVWGAGHQSLFILENSILFNRVDFVIDSSPAKQGKFIPGINKKVMHPSILALEGVSLLFVICAGYNDEVLSCLRSMHLHESIQVFSVSDNSLHLEVI